MYRMAELRVAYHLFIERLLLPHHILHIHFLLDRPLLSLKFHLLTEIFGLTIVHSYQAKLAVDWRSFIAELISYLWLASLIKQLLKCCYRYCRLKKTSYFQVRAESYFMLEHHYVSFNPWRLPEPRRIQNSEILRLFNLEFFCHKD